MCWLSLQLWYDDDDGDDDGDDDDDDDDGNDDDNDDVDAYKEDPITYNASSKIEGQRKIVAICVEEIVTVQKCLTMIKSWPSFKCLT